MSQRIAMVTGASSGIGLLAAVELARSGFHVVATMRDLGRRGALEEAARSAGVQQRLDFCLLDVTQFALIPGVVDSILRMYGRVDVLLNNAGFAVAGFAEDLKLEEIREQFETNFFGHVAVTKALLPSMRGQKSGHIIMLSSVSGLVGQPVIGTYSASKFALEGWSEALRVELLPLGIRVVLVEPGSFKTDIWGRNAKLGQAVLDPGSPNYERGRRFAEYVQKKVPKRDPQRVAELITRVAVDPAPKLRYRIGGDAHLQYWLRRCLPWKAYEKLVLRALRIA